MGFGFTGRHGETRPDNKMSSEEWKWVKRSELTSKVNKTMKKRAAKKRRQRDKTVDDG